MGWLALLALMAPFLMAGAYAGWLCLRVDAPPADRVVLGFGIVGLVLVPFAGFHAPSFEIGVACFLVAPFLVSLAYLARLATGATGKFAGYYVTAGLGFFFLTGLPLIVMTVAYSALSSPGGWH